MQQMRTEFNEERKIDKLDFENRRKELIEVWARYEHRFNEILQN